MEEVTVICDALLPEFDQEMANTRKTLERCPEDKYGWKPHPKSFSMASLATHIANMTGWTTDVMEKDSFDIAPVGAPPYKEDPAASREVLLAKFDQNVAAARAALAGASDERFAQTWSLLAGGETLLSMPRGACIRSFVMNHTIHHRAQLTVYLRLNDVPVPAIYGPSADEQG
jgi:uncharacterized damage-inducible protein DinB